MDESPIEQQVRAFLQEIPEEPRTEYAVLIVAHQTQEWVGETLHTFDWPEAIVVGGLGDYICGWTGPEPVEDRPSFSSPWVGPYVMIPADVYYAIRDPRLHAKAQLIPRGIAPVWEREE